jgi:hypothetical protein
MSRGLGEKMRKEQKRNPLLSFSGKPPDTKKKHMETPGFDPGASRMRSARSAN